MPLDLSRFVADLETQSLPRTLLLFFNTEYGTSIGPICSIVVPALVSVFLHGTPDR